MYVTHCVKCKPKQDIWCEAGRLGPGCLDNDYETFIRSVHVLCPSFEREVISNVDTLLYRSLANILLTLTPCEGVRIENMMQTWPRTRHGREKAGTNSKNQVQVSPSHFTTYVMPLSWVMANKHTATVTHK